MKFEMIQADGNHLDNLPTIEEMLRAKLQMISSLHKIIDGIPEDNIEETETEVLEQEDHIYNQQSKFQQTE